jgi:hypothetical protein
MSKRSGMWKNTAEGKTIKRNSVAQHFTSRPVELIANPALRILSRAAHLALLRIELELRSHAGQGNGKLIVTKQQFAEFGIHPRMIAAALRELNALGIVITTTQGRGGNAEHRQPNLFLLNYMCGAIDAHEQITDTWKRFKTLEEAEKTASAARKAKDETKVIYGRRTARNRNNFRGHKVYPKPGTQSAPEIQKFSGSQSVPTGPGAQSVPTVDISGGGGGRGGRFPKSPRAALPQAESPGLPMWSVPVLTELEWSVDWQQRYAEVTGETRSATMCIDHKLDIPTYLLRGHPDCWKVR